ncbi:MAG TPA: SDR family NAD(P)-dependent oxidoreductase, partial [Candidatus Angelobacter sp.]
MALPGYVSTMAGKDARQTALITGASSGIGYDLAQLMAADFDLIVTARNQKKLEQLAQELEGRHGNHVHVVPADLARTDAPTQIFSEIARRGLQVDALVNNAGFGAHGEFKSTLLEDELQMIQVNVTALTHLTKLALPGMLERKRGRILNVASTAGFQPGPFMA